MFVVFVPGLSIKRDCYKLPRLLYINLAIRKARHKHRRIIQRGVTFKKYRLCAPQVL